MAGVCGFISSVISIYQIAKEINENNWEGQVKRKMQLKLPYKIQKRLSYLIW